MASTRITSVTTRCTSVFQVNGVCGFTIYQSSKLPESTNATKRYKMLAFFFCADPDRAGFGLLNTTRKVIINNDVSIWIYNRVRKRSVLPEFTFIVFVSV